MRFKVKGYVKVPVEVIIEAVSAREAMCDAEDAVADEVRSGSHIFPEDGLEYLLDGDTIPAIINIKNGYEYDMGSAKEIK